MLLSLNLLALTSCGNRYLKINLGPEYSELVEIDKDELSSLLEDKNDFILLVTLSTCTTCQSAKNVFNDYILNRHVEIFTTYYSNTTDFNFDDKIVIIPSVLFFEGGKMIDIKSRNLTDSKEVYNLLDSYIRKS